MASEHLILQKFKQELTNWIFEEDIMIERYGKETGAGAAHLRAALAHGKALLALNRLIREAQEGSIRDEKIDELNADIVQLKEGIKNINDGLDIILKNGPKSLNGVLDFVERLKSEIDETFKDMKKIG